MVICFRKIVWVYEYPAHKQTNKITLLKIYIYIYNKNFFKTKIK